MVRRGLVPESLIHSYSMQFGLLFYHGANSSSGFVALLSRFFVGKGTLDAILGH